MGAKKLTIISGAGISVASGLKTFRGENGLWEGYDIMKVASIEGWHQDPELVLEFYNKRRAQLREVEPNTAHILCAMLEKHFEVQVVTQNVDNLHERAGSSNVLHLHGALNKVRSTVDSSYVIDWSGDLCLGELCPSGAQLRPAIVWFGEEVPLMDVAAQMVYDSDFIIIVGTSMQVYPAAGLVNYANEKASIFYVDPAPQPNYELSRLKNLRTIEKDAVVGMQILYDFLSKVD
jgi:NAD-dependent deacetylase